MGSDAGGALHCCGGLKLLRHKQPMFVPRSPALSKSWKRCFGRLTGAKQAQHISTLSAWATTSSSFAKLVKCVAGAAGKAHALDGEFGAGPTTGALLQPFGKQQLGRTGAPCGIDNAAPRQEHASQVRAAAAGLRFAVASACACGARWRWWLFCCPNPRCRLSHGAGYAWKPSYGGACCRTSCRRRSGRSATLRRPSGGAGCGRASPCARASTQAGRDGMRLGALGGAMQLIP